MGMTIVEKILARAGGRRQVAAGDLVVVDVDLAVMLDASFQATQRREILKVHDPERVAVVYDHMVPAPDRQAAEAHAYGRAFVRRFGIRRFHDVGPDQGICHAIVADHAYALPGTVLVCGDSHTCASGAFNCAARGIGAPDLVAAVTTGKTWFRVGPTIRYDLEGALKPGVSAKDLFLHIAGNWGHHTNQNVEFGGPALAGLGIDARRTIAAMGPSFPPNSPPSSPTSSSSPMSGRAPRPRSHRNTPTPMRVMPSGGASISTGLNRSSPCPMR
ncbi:MAG TPA: aconitase family protein [Stellaceae bacterium]|nr:aconitase family protein [Stellaceae bacterium]